jgi:4-hydroxybenzoate polyprenyltransferase
MPFGNILQGSSSLSKRVSPNNALLYLNAMMLVFASSRWLLNTTTVLDRNVGITILGVYSKQRQFMHESDDVYRLDAANTPGVV